MEVVDRADFRLLGGVAAVVRQVVMAVGNADRAGSFDCCRHCEDECRNSREIGLKCQHQQITHHA